jgi:hypothetical protein
MHIKSFLMGLSLAGAFILGCVSAPLMGPVVVPRAQAESYTPANGSTHGWGYLCMNSVQSATFQDSANDFGRSGWELVGSNWDYQREPYWCFKRPLPAPSDATQ